MTYQYMAHVYDDFMSSAPYDQWVLFTEKVLESSHKQVNRIADLGCGTGEITTLLANKGYSLTGIDNSAEMLSLAEQKAFKQNLNIHWLKQDLRSLDGLNHFDAAISFCDVINYITTLEDVKRVFQNVWNLLNNGGLFLFDVHSIAHVENNMVNNTFAEVTDKTSYIWFCNEGDVEGEMYHDLTFFTLNNNHYSRFDETHFQKVYSTDVYKQLLKENGFKINGIYNDFQFCKNSFTKSPERIFFVVEKIGI